MTPSGSHAIRSLIMPDLFINVVLFQHEMSHCSRCHSFDLCGAASCFIPTLSHCCSLSDKCKTRTHNETLFYLQLITTVPPPTLHINHVYFQHFTVVTTFFLRVENKTAALFVQQVASDTISVFQHVFVFFFFQLLRRPRRPTDL